MLVTTQCASYCRYCTRSRIVGDPTQNFNRRDHEAQLDYLRRTPQVRDVLISGGDGLTLAPKLFEKILRGLREIPHIEIIRIGSRVPVFLPQRIDDELCEMLAEVPPAVDQPPLQPPERDHARGRARGRQADQGRAPGRQPERPARRRERLRAHPARARPQARREPDPAVLPVPVRPGRGLRALPDAGRQGPRDHGGPARAHVGLRGPDLRHRCARRRRQDPGHAQLPDQLLATTRWCCATTRATSPRTRSRRRTSSTTRRPACTASTSARSPASRASWACSRASGCGSSRRGFEEIHTRGNTEAHRLQDPSKWVPYGVGAIEGTVERGAARPRRPAISPRPRLRIRTTRPARSPGPARASRPRRPTASCSSPIIRRPVR